ncbi:MAG: rRNA pseudouridine synthase [Bacteroidia bacterium]
MKPKNYKEPKQTYRLNKFLAMTNAAPSRRSADDLITDGKIKINGKVEKNHSCQIDPTKDIVEFQGNILKFKNEFKYILFNKPKDCITTRNDEKNRKTVYDFLKYDFKNDLKPVGRLDRNTTGLLLFTNDGEFINKLTHPSNHVTKIYQATLDKNITKNDLENFVNGATLEDGEFIPDEIALLEQANQVGIQIHSGKNRIVRRYFEHFGFRVKQLDRVFIAGLTKYKLPRGKTRELNPKELRFINNQVAPKNKK